MSASKRARPGLDALPFATKAVPAIAAEPPLFPLPPVEAEPPIKGKADDRVPVIIRISPEERRQLKMISARDGRTVQDMVADAIADIIRRSR